LIALSEKAGMDPDALRRDEEKGLEQKALGAHAVHAAILAEGRTVVSRSWRALGWSGLAAGISMGLSLLTEGVLHAHLPDTDWRPLVASLGYTLGFVVVILGRQQLFTETTLTATVPLLHDPSFRMLGGVSKLWAVVLVANLLGGLLFAWTLSHPSVAGPELRHAFAEIAREAARHDPWSSFVRGIVGGWIIALTAWLMPAGGSMRLSIIIAMTYVIAVAQFTHIIAGSIEYLYGVVTGQESWRNYFIRFFLPVLSGNSLGGIVFVAALNHAQSVSGTAGAGKP
jgi:formate/nitrite transporter FocA (FNT family)